MKNKTIRSILAVIFALGTLAVTACDSASTEQGYEKLDIWSTYNTVKVLRDSSDYPNLGQKLDVSMAKGEREGGQVIVNPKGGNIRDLFIQTTDLVSENGDIFSKENVTVYLQKYIYVESKSGNQQNMDYPIGYTPDMLLEQGLADEYGENTVKANQNQGITVEFATTAQTPAGTYTGTFHVVADQQKFVLPITLTVWDIDITQPNGKTAVDYVGREWLMGEYDMTEEMYRRYFEKAMNEYKFMLDLPGNGDPVTLKDDVLHYWDNVNFTGYNIPLPTYYNSKVVQKGYFYEYVMELAKASTPEKLLFEKAYIVARNVDEVRAADYETVYQTQEIIYQTEDLVFADLEKSGYFDKYNQEYKERFLKEIRDIPVILTVDADQVDYFGTDVNTYCAYAKLLNDSAARDTMHKAADANAERGGEVWFYTAMHPLYPYPSHHIDDYLLGSRVMRWMQKDYDIEGYLHWSFFYYNRFTDGAHIQVDPYEQAVRFSTINGDGFLAYPGKKYGLDSFIPSIRLTTFRDGQEDYDLLCALDKAVEKKETFYGLSAGTVSTETQLAEYYKQLYTGAIYVPDDELFYAVRQQVADIVLSQETQSNYLLQTEVTKEVASANIYVKNGYEVTVNGVKLNGQSAGQGLKYSVEYPRTQDAKLDIQIAQGASVVEEYHVFLAAKSVDVSLDESCVYVSTDSTVSNGQDGVNVTLCSWGESNRDKLSFVPSMGFAATTFGKLTDVASVSFVVTNLSTQSISFGVRFKAGSLAYVVYNTNVYTLAAGESVTVRVNSLYEYENSFSNLADATLEIFMNNLDENNEKYGARSFSVTQVYYEGKGE